MSTLNHLRGGIILVVLAVFGLAAVSSASVEYTTTLIAIEGQQAPNQPGDFTSLGYPVLNSQGQIAFGAQYDGGSGLGHHGLYFWSGSSLTHVADQSMHIPGDPVNRYFSIFSDPILVNLGHVAFSCGAFGVYRWDGGSLVTITDVWNTPVPDHPGSYFNWVLASSINHSGVVALRGQSAGAGVTSGVYTGTGGSLTKIIDSDTPVPGQPGASFWRFEYSAINTSEDVAFRGNYEDGEGTHGLYIYTSGVLQRIADGNTVPPGQASPFGVLLWPSLNASARVAFRGYSSGIGPPYHGTYLWTSGQLEVIADSNSGFDSFQEPRINDNSVAAFHATAGGFHIVRVDSGVVELIATSNDPVPGLLDASFEDFWQPSINANGAVAFCAIWSSPTLGTSEGIYTDVGCSLAKVVDTNDILVDSLKASDLHLLDSVDLGGRNPFNDTGQVAFWAELSDGRQAVFLADPVFAPDPGDFDDDCRVDFVDFAILASYWQVTDCSALNNWCQGVDFEPDGDVDLNDLAEVTDNWLFGK